MQYFAFHATRFEYMLLPLFAALAAVLCRFGLRNLAGDHLNQVLGDNLNQVHVIGTLDYVQRSSMLNVGLSCPLQGADLSVHSISSLTFDAEAAKNMPFQQSLF